MRSEFRFPTAAGVFMVLTLALVLLAIEKGNELSIGISRESAPGGAAPWTRFALLPGTLETFLGACLVGALAWCVLFAMRKSGIQRLSDKLEPK
jgi:hypothetical protein